MSLVVQKFGGTSVGDIDRLQAVAKRVVSQKNKWDQMVVVVSAMGGETDRLIDMAGILSQNPQKREMDLLLTSGERISSSLLSIAINSLGFPSISLTGGQAGIMTDGEHLSARVRTIRPDRIIRELDSGRIVVAAGFQGVDEFNEETTLGRGGSDLTAVALAASLNADLCEIYTDVDGVYTADPRIVEKSVCLKEISFDEMMEMAVLGAKVLQPRAVDLAAKYNLPLVVRSSFGEGEGTLIKMEDDSLEAPAVSGVNCDKKQSKITVLNIPDEPGIASKLFGKLAESSIMIDMIVQNVGEKGYADISITVNRDFAQDAESIIEGLKSDFGDIEIIRNDEIAKVSVVGIGMKSQAGVAARVFSALSESKINILMISTSEISISVIIDTNHSENAVKLLHKEFIE
jgi:aspartate kinase